MSFNTKAMGRVCAAAALLLVSGISFAQVQWDKSDPVAGMIRNVQRKIKEAGGVARNPLPAPGRRWTEKDIRCESAGPRAVCETGLMGIRVERWAPISERSCMPQRDWGIEPDGASLWVDHGCQAWFTVGGYIRN